jgi:ankyrin repeat protein
MRKLRHMAAATGVLLVAAPCWLLVRAGQQDRLDSALIAAIRRDDPAKVRALLAEGADPNARDRPVRSLMDRIRELLRVRKAPVSETALMVALEFRSNPDLTPKDVPHAAETVVALLDAGAAVDVRNADGDAPLHLGVRPGYSRSVGPLLARGASVDARDDEGKTPLLRAARYNEPHVIRAMLDHGADINAQDTSGWTAMMLSLHAAQDQITEVLLERNADLRIKARDGLTAAGVAGYAYPSAASRKVRLLSKSGR